ncbi:hypothetical protein TRFO_35680 [Tritrichomonas foetus]|uniref:Uncharacterized protein n=1 Tax=Tritrichomonas foetus TaxID=1144522 RepID=A0A1J4JL83_9EUKA|nr:hypothetical protein TRFO_35680 [Tritrichomonas foetus]|eukprot:OHS98028.1 hypothetical protein TRFO_35680 [Tritrichomonas foetus]
MLIHNYYETNPKKLHGLYILIVSSLFASSKQFEMTRSMQAIFLSLLACLREFEKRMNADVLKKLIGLNDFSERQMTPLEISQVNNCEMDLIEANNFCINLDLPFQYTQEIVQPNLSNLPKEIAMNIEGQLIKFLCVMLCSEHCSDYPPELVAAITTNLAFQGIEIPEPIREWIQNVSENYGNSVVEAAQQLLNEQIESIIPKHQQ